MSDTKTGDDKTLSVTSKPTLTLKRPGLEHSMVKQNFSHGRSKAVVVETKKRKFSLPGDKPEPGAGIFKPAPTPQPAPRPIPVMPERAPRPAVPANPPAAPVVAAPAPAPVAAAPAAAPRTAGPAPARPQSAAPAASPARPASRPINHGMVLNVLSNDEMAARRRALEGAGFRNDDERRTAVEEARRRAQEEGLRKREAEDSARRQAEEEARLRTEAEAKRRAEDEARRRTPGADAAVVEPGVAARPGFRRPMADMDDSRSGRSSGPRGAAGFSSSRAAPKAEVRVPKTRVIEPDNRHRLTVVSATAGEEGDARGRSMAATRRRQEKFRRAQMQEVREKVAREVILPETISIQELAQRMSERAVDVIKYLMKQGQMMTPGDIIDADLAELLAGEFGHTVKRVADSDVEEGFFNVTDIEGDLQPRAPVVTIMGHVDHGKTSLLDAIRKTNVVSGEAGGITQHIGAYQVERNGQKITFIDTPGHAAFTAMRARGAQATDIAILVVAADDAVMPQTIESINHAKAAKVPMIVAINKVDKHDADAQKVRTGLLQHEVFVESLGGETLDVEVSAKTGQGLDKLLEAILLQSEVLELKANPNRPAEGVVVEAKLDRGRGSVATVLIQAGTLRIGDIIVAGSEWGRVRALVTDKGDHVKEAGPSMPIEVLGLQGPPQAGDRIAVIDSEARAREISEYRQHKNREKAVAKQAGSRGSLEQMMTQLSSAGTKEFPLLIKGDVQGSIEAITGALDKISTEEVRARIIHSGAGAITESDVSLAAASNAAIIGFNVRANTQARDAAAKEGIEIRYYNIIYDLTDDVKAAMSGLLSPERRETYLGNAEILEVFNITKVGKIAGCRVTEGKVERAQDAQALQGRSRRSPDRPGMRHGLRGLRGSARWRRHRVLPRRGNQAVAVKLRPSPRGKAQNPD
jgi:translation initiation factor IF-2